MSDGAKTGSPLVGVVGGSRSDFPTLEAAQNYAMREGIDAHVVPASQPKLKLQSYADNFR